MKRLNSLIAKDLNIPHASLLMTACRAALQAGDILKSLLGQPISISLKGPTNLVTEADLAAEKAIVTCLMQDTPALAIMTEESEQTHSPALSRQVWVVDPLDGTTNFAHGFPHFAVSIALLDSGSPLVAAIYAPMVDELFYAVRNYGAWLNTHPICVTMTHNAAEALIGTGFPYEIKESLPAVLRHLKTFLLKTRDLRRAGAAALDLAYVACGRLDGFYEMGLCPWDTAAGWLLIEEAGGTMTDFSGNTFSPFFPEVLASNRVLHQDLLQMLHD